MAAPAEGRARTFESGPSATDNHAVAVAGATSFPHGANAIIEPLALTTNGGRRRQIDGGSGSRRAGARSPTR
ncbi:hypothetical protein YP76_15955 [Sphingobium chungbukense]|uniref:Uncharacterized protein n=1 Tax=Sphingobium chungbukense TaxID=56193 RepID=A0A0M3AML3_9SPHN|nr:hypothetical protein YP76_15955 [Sphingobium chungbukense]